MKKRRFKVYFENQLFRLDLIVQNDKYIAMPSLDFVYTLAFIFDCQEIFMTQNKVFKRSQHSSAVTFFSTYSFWAFFLILCAFYEKFQNLLSSQRKELEMSSYIKATHQSLLEDFFIRLAKLSTFSNLHSAFFSPRKRILLAFPVSI